MCAADATRSGTRSTRSGRRTDADADVRLSRRTENPFGAARARHNQPTLNMNALDAGGGVGGQGRTIIPAVGKRATSTCGSCKPSIRRKSSIGIVAHVRSRVISSSIANRTRRCARPTRSIARVTRAAGTRPAARPWIRRSRGRCRCAHRAAGGQIVRLPTLGGNARRILCSADVLNIPTFGLSIVNFDNNQHGPEQNCGSESLGRNRIDGGAVT